MFYHFKVGRIKKKKTLQKRRNVVARLRSVFKLNLTLSTAWIITTCKKEASISYPHDWVVGKKKIPKFVEKVIPLARSLPSEIIRYIHTFL